MGTERNAYVSKYFFLSENFISSPEYSIKYWLSVFFNVYFIIVFWDVMRDALAFPSIIDLVVSGIRDISIYLVVIYILFSKKSVVSGYKAFYFIVYPFIPLIIYFGTVIEGFSNHPLKEIVQFCILSAKPFLFTYILENLGLFYVLKKNAIVKSFISIIVFMFFISFIVFLFFPSLIVRYNIENRFGLGNMSVQSGLYCCAYFLCLYYFPYKRKIINWISIFILLIGILLSVSSTGIFSALIGTVLFLFDKRTRKRSAIVFIVVCILSMIVVIKYYSFISGFVDYFVGKWRDALDLAVSFLSGQYQGKSESVSFHARELQISNFMNNHNDLIYRFFGHGFFSITDRDIFIENTYFALYFDCGIFGIILLTILILKLSFKAMELWFKKGTYLGIASIISWLFFMTTLDISILPPISTAFVFLFYFIFHNDKFMHEVLN